ncbi:MAG: hypothetical protein WDN03_13535 [Rhizomicrobium sp.]
MSASRAERFGLARQQGGDQPAQPDRFGGGVAAVDVGAGGVGPAFGIGGIDRLQHGIETFAEIGTVRHAERNGGGADLGLGAHQALAHRRGRDEKRRGDGGGVEAEHALQDQRRTHRRLDRGMGAGEHQGEALVGNVGRRGAGELVGHELQVIRGRRRCAWHAVPYRWICAAPQ